MRSYKYKVMLFFILIILIPVFFILASSLYRLNGVLEKNRQSAAADKTELIGNNFNTFITNIENIFVAKIYENDFVYLLQSDLQAGGIDQVKNYIGISPMMTDYISSISVYSIKNGMLISTDPSKNIIDENRGIRARYENISRKSLMGRWIADIDPTNVISLNLEIYSTRMEEDKTRTNEIVGYMTISMDMTYLNSMLAKRSMGNSIRILVINDMGTVLSSSDSTMVGNDIDTLGYSRSLKKLAEINVVDEISGEKYYIYMKSYKNSRFKYIALVPYSSITNEVLQITNPILIIGLFAIILSVPFALLFYRSIYHPISKMRYYMNKVSEDGAFDVEITDSRSDEFGTLYKVFNKMTSKIKALINELYVKNLLVRDMEIKMLQSQINPHFLYNALNTISCMSIKVKDYDTAKMVNYLSDFLRLSLNNGKDFITISETVRQVESYCEIQKARFPDAFETVLEYQEELADISIPKLLVQPLVENSILHGMKSRKNRVVIQLSIFKVNEIIKIIVRDNGNGIPIEKMRRIEKMLEDYTVDFDGALYALKNINMRIKLNYGSEYGLYIYSSEGEGTTSEITIPMPSVKEEMANEASDSR